MGDEGLVKEVSANEFQARENFLKRARLIHGDEYDYSETVYINSKTKIKIICPKHGEFWQTPDNHLNLKCKCPKCSKKGGKGKIFTTQQFIDKARSIHGNKYDYSQVEYKNNRTKVKIICKEHGLFEQTPNSHLQGHSCPKCSNNIKITTKDFIEKANLIHHNLYDYSLVDYINANSKVKIICPLHGVFEQIARKHIAGASCPKCKGRNKTNEEFIKEANEVHNGFFDYSETNFINTNTKVRIICPLHGAFEQLPISHLKGCSCPKCKNSKGEKQIRNYLTKNNILFEEQKTFPELKDVRLLSYDFYIPSKNLLIEYQGEQHYFNSFNKDIHLFHKQKHHDWLKRKYARDNNLELLTISYKDNILTSLGQVL